MLAPKAKGHLTTCAPETSIPAPRLPNTTCYFSHSTYEQSPGQKPQGNL